MALSPFQNWIEYKKLIQEETDNPFLTADQQTGDKVYFGIHDLARIYGQVDSTPSLEYAEIMDKCGEIVDVDVVDNHVVVNADKAPYYFGYRTLEGKTSRDKRKRRGVQVVEVKIPCSHLLDISHLVTGDHKVWLVIDKNTKYQQEIIKKIRRKEMRHYMTDPEYNLDEPEGMEDVKMLDRPIPNDLHHYQFRNREIEPVHFQLKAHYDPWKSHGDTRKYSFYD